MLNRELYDDTNYDEDEPGPCSQLIAGCMSFMLLAYLFKWNTNSALTGIRESAHLLASAHTEAEAQEIQQHYAVGLLIHSYINFFLSLSLLGSAGMIFTMIKAIIQTRQPYNAPPLDIALPIDNALPIAPQQENAHTFTDEQLTNMDVDQLTCPISLEIPSPQNAVLITTATRPRVYDRHCLLTWYQHEPPNSSLLGIPSIIRDGTTFTRLDIVAAPPSVVAQIESHTAEANENSGQEAIITISP
ncbi:MAG: hypothetical protein P1U34_12250 [Coxiellaceae bacterium]|nr:hypothetical protein [Coxiellaceae bacterium]